MAEKTDSQMPMRTLGQTGVKVSLIGLGGWHLGFKSIDEELSIRIIRTAIDNGVDFMDNCWDYNEGASEVRMGKALRDGYRERVFLMTKIDGRTKEEATKQLDESLRRMQTDHVDLVQHHEILRFEDPHRIQYAMNLPTSVVITGCEGMDDLEQALNAAHTFNPMTEAQVKSLLSRTEKAAARGEFELFKTTSVYDGTASHPEWLGEEPPEVQRVMQA